LTEGKLNINMTAVEYTVAIAHVPCRKPRIRQQTKPSNFKTGRGPADRIDSAFLIMTFAMIGKTVDETVDFSDRRAINGKHSRFLSYYLL
jgi:hypothetical protein